MCEVPAPIGSEGCGKVVGGVMNALSRSAVAYFQIERPVGAIDKVMTALLPSRKSCGHARREHGLAFIGHQDDLTFKNIAELVLPLMPVAKRGSGAGLEPCQIYPEVPQASGIA